MVSFPSVERSMPTKIKRKSIDGLNTAQLIVLCPKNGIHYYAKALKPRIVLRRGELWAKLPKSSDNASSVAGDFWTVLMKMKIHDKMSQCDDLLQAERR